ncbi:hypothetical protein [Pseudonocardia spinosispora]|uniref:hypothetical protein n=1 Tax=Pseudonocardia spinosispora TaxID=103441 RepID=UPI00041789A7|nr:hypothetical protein [Pseudonocardia spinosispora]
MSLTDAPPSVISRLPGIAAFAAPVGLCALTGTTALYLAGYLANTPSLDELSYRLFSSWSLWTQLATALFAVVALAGRHRRTTGVAAATLMVPPVVRDLLFFIQDGTSVPLFYWALSLTKMILGLFVAVMLACLVRHRGYWQTDHSSRTRVVGEGVLWPWLLYVALPAGALEVAAAYGALAFLATPVLNPYSALVLWVGPLAAGALFLLAVGPGAPRYGWRIGFRPGPARAAATHPGRHGRPSDRDLLLQRRHWSSPGRRGRVDLRPGRTARGRPTGRGPARRPHCPGRAGAGVMTNDHSEDLNTAVEHEALSSSLGARAGGARPGWMRFAALVGLCALVGVSLAQFVLFVVGSAVRGVFLAAIGPGWPLWLPTVVQLFTLVALVQRRRRASGVAAAALLVPSVVTGVFFSTQEAPVPSYYWLNVLAGLIPAVFIAALLVSLVRDPGQWQPAHHASGRRWWAYLLWVAVPAGALQVGVCIGTLGLIPGSLDPYSAVLLWISPAAAVGLFLATAGRGTPGSTARLGAGLVLLSRLPAIGLVAAVAASDPLSYGGASPSPLLTVTATCGPLALVVTFLLVTGTRAARADVTKVCAQ